ncbi:hypothetical protein PCNPT3_01260 [Psychromonas sp. CNPT3]|nr:hypothetical protein PCNPT3_01260 [Psychromonas sp. CNPT3]
MSLKSKGDVLFLAGYIKAVIFRYERDCDDKNKPYMFALCLHVEIDFTQGIKKPLMRTLRVFEMFK